MPVRLELETVESGFPAARCWRRIHGPVSARSMRTGLFVALPATLDLPRASRHRRARSALDVIDPSQKVGVIGAWDRVREMGAAHVNVSLRGGEAAVLYFFDLTASVTVSWSACSSRTGDLSTEASQAAVEIAPANIGATKERSRDYHRGG